MSSNQNDKTDLILCSRNILLCMCHIKLHYKNYICSTLCQCHNSCSVFCYPIQLPLRLHAREYILWHCIYKETKEQATPSTQQCKSNMAVQECSVYQSSINHLFTHLVSLFATRSDFLDQRVEWFFFSGFSGCIAGCTSQQAMLL